MRHLLRVALLGAVAVTACDKFLSVPNPNSLESDAIDPTSDAKLLSQSVYTQFVGHLEELYVYGAWFTNHARVGDTFPTRNEFGRRQISNVNSNLQPFWDRMGSDIQFARVTIANTAAAGTTVDLVRNWFVSGYSIFLEAEYFCEGTIAQSTTVPRGKMTTNALLDSAIADLRKAQAAAAALPATTAAADLTEATNLSNAAQVAIAQAYLQKGDNANASIEAAKVANNFSFSVVHIDNSTQRALGNQIWNYSEARISLVVGPEFRAMADAGDPRIKYTDMGRLSQDGILEFYRQGKIAGWGSSERVASGLEAQYIKIEADQNTANMLAFINTRRAAGNQGAYAGATDITSLMTELMLQKSKDFWLEGKEVPDFRRNQAIYPFVLPTGLNSYYKPQLGPVATDVCWPVPKSELNNNLNWNK